MRTTPTPHHAAFTATSPVVRFDETIDAESSIGLLRQFEHLYIAATSIYIICDNARQVEAIVIRHEPVYLVARPYRIPRRAATWTFAASTA